MERNKVQDRRSIKLEHVLKEGYIPYRTGRPERRTMIGEDDVVNLRIALNTAESLEEFLSHV